MFKKQYIFSILIIFIQSFISIANAYDNNFVHQIINGNAAQQSTEFQRTIKNYGFKDIYDSVNKKEIWQWFYDGAKLEDETVCRSRNHFHDPLKSWDKAGLNNIAINSFCFSFSEDFSVDSSLIWAQKQPGLLFTKNFWSWLKARAYYYDALTKSNKDEREIFFAQTFRALGQVMHLIADSSVPAHVRNDIHVFPLTIPGIGIEVGGRTYESWAKANWSKLIYSGFNVDQLIFKQATYNSSAPVPISALWDIDRYWGTNPEITQESIIGLAEYTNANFFSEDTIFKDYLHPARENTNFSSFDLLPVTVITTPGNINHDTFYIRGYGKEHLAGLKYFSKEITDSLNERYQLNLMLDNRCYEEYAKYLIPRAVGYSAGLLNYFFRGDINLKYETGTNRGYVIVNNTNEDMSGEFGIYYDNSEDKRVKIWSKGFTLKALQKSDIFDFLPPGDSKEAGKYILVFRGRLGKENGAVVGNVSSVRALEITPPDKYVYSVIDGSQIPQQFTKIKLKIRNITGEEIQNGALQAMAEYIKRTDYQPDLSTDPPTDESRELDFSYSVSETIAVPSLSATEPIEFTFDFTSNPIPAGITDLNLKVIFKGTIGDEIDTAQAIGTKDIMEPTHHVFWNLSDMFSINGHLYTSEQIKANPDLVSLVDLDHDGIFNETSIGEPYIDPVFTDFKITYMANPPASTINQIATVDMLPAGKHIRLIVLVNRWENNYLRLTWFDNVYPESYFDFVFSGALNQEVMQIVNGQEEVVFKYTPPTTFRSWLDSDGFTRIPIKQHFSQGVLSCWPLSAPHECYYPEEEAIPADPDPIPVSILFP